MGGYRSGTVAISRLVTAIVYRRKFYITIIARRSSLQIFAVSFGGNNFYMTGTQFAWYFVEGDKFLTSGLRIFANKDY